ncbi:hypothetical protein Tco_0546623 [Tanacetum coccineum]
MGSIRLRVGPEFLESVNDKNMPRYWKITSDDASGSGSTIVITSNSLQTEPDKVDAIANVLLALKRIDQDERLTF